MTFRSSFLTAMVIGAIAGSSFGAPTDRLIQAGARPAASALSSKTTVRSLAPVSRATTTKLRRAVSLNSAKTVAATVTRLASTTLDRPGDTNRVGDTELGTTCRADSNGDGLLNETDVFAFLNMYFAANPGADVNSSGGVSVQDLFDFVSLYLAGCPGR